MSNNTYTGINNQKFNTEYFIKNYGSNFDCDVYKKYSYDLAHMCPQDLEDHFIAHGFAEKRIFSETTSTSEFLSMKWLRGLGLEIGAGRYPTKLYGNAKCEYADTQGGEIFGTKSILHRFSIDDPMPINLISKFDFVIASHVLEHADNFIKAIENMLMAIKVNGILYIVVPDKTYIEDVNWMPEFDFEHHHAEYLNPGIYDELHDKLAVDYLKKSPHLLHPSGDSQFNSSELDSRDMQVKPGSLLKLLGKMDVNYRFMLHKHTYDFNSWLKLFVDTQNFLNNFTISEVRYGIERMDFHIIITKKS